MALYEFYNWKYEFINRIFLLVFWGIFLIFGRVNFVLQGLYDLYWREVFRIMWTLSFLYRDIYVLEGHKIRSHAGPTAQGLVENPGMEGPKYLVSWRNLRLFHGSKQNQTNGMNYIITSQEFHSQPSSLTSPYLAKRSQSRNTKKSVNFFRQNRAALINPTCQLGWMKMENLKETRPSILCVTHQMMNYKWYLMVLSQYMTILAGTWSVSVGTAWY